MTYQASTVKRSRSSKAEMEAFRSELYSIVEANRPCSVRQVYYMGIGRLWEKDQGGSRRNYARVIENLGTMRENGSLPFEWIADSTRYRRLPTMFDSHQDALAQTAEFYRRDLWSQQPRRVEVWAESDSITGVIDPVTRALGVGLFSCRGQASKTFAHSSAVEYLQTGKPVSVLYVGDWDPSGFAIARSLHERLNRYSRGEVEIEFVRVAVNTSDVRSGSLTSHDLNPNDRNTQRFQLHCRGLGLDPHSAIEVEAIPAPDLRARLETALLDRAEDVATWNAVLAAEESERNLLMEIAGKGAAV